MREQEMQDMFLERLGRRRAEELQRIWNSTYPRYCSLNDEYPCNHTKEEIFKVKAKESDFTSVDIDLFLDL